MSSAPPGFVLQGASLCIASALLTLRHVVPAASGVPVLPGADPTLGAGGPAEPADQGGPSLRLATRHRGHVHQQVRQPVSLKTVFESQRGIKTSDSPPPAVSEA